MPKRQGAGRKEININWDEVNRYLISGCSGKDAALAIGISDNTLYERCKKDHKMNFCDYVAKNRQKGDCLLHAKQFQIAMEGNTSMLIWLGKQRLGQSEQPKNKEEFNGSLANLLDILHLVKNAEDFTALIEMAKKQKESSNS